MQSVGKFQFDAPLILVLAVETASAAGGWFSHSEMLALNRYIYIIYIQEPIQTYT